MFFPTKKRLLWGVLAALGVSILGGIVLQSPLGSPALQRFIGFFLVPAFLVDLMLPRYSWFKALLAETPVLIMIQLIYGYLIACIVLSVTGYQRKDIR